jgi:hypothetical protein
MLPYLITYLSNMRTNSMTTIVVVDIIGGSEILLLFIIPT